MVRGGDRNQRFGGEHDDAGIDVGQYHQRLSEEGANVVILEPDVAQAFSLTRRQ